MINHISALDALVLTLQVLFKVACNFWPAYILIAIFAVIMRALDSRAN